MTDEAGPVTFLEFSEVIDARFHLERGTIAPEMPVRELFSSGVARAAVFAAFFDLAGGLETEVQQEIVTFGEALDWINIARSNGHGRPYSSMGDRVWLRGLRASDVPLMFDASMAPASYHRWRFRGQRPTPEQFSELLHRGVLAQFMVEDRRSRTAQGLVCAYDYQPENQLCFIAFQRVAPSLEGAELTIGMFYLIEFLFDRFPLRKVYADVMEWNLDVVDGEFGPVKEEGRLLEYSFHCGKWWDRIFLSILREDWERFAIDWRPLVGQGLAPDFS